jgi:hypothetical protein
VTLRSCDDRSMRREFVTDGKRPRLQPSHTACHTDFLLTRWTPSTEVMQPAELEDVSAADAESDAQALPTDTDFGKLWGLHNTGQSVNGTIGTATVTSMLRKRGCMRSGAAMWWSR